MAGYKIKEIYYTLQGEGAHAGRSAVFLRFTGCNLWSGREEDRHKAICKFCDTDFWGTDGQNGGKYPDAKAVAEKVNSLWPENGSNKYVVCTGGEPMLQLNKELVDAFHDLNFEVAVETNGTLPVPEGLDWICVSPKANTEVVLERADEIKLVYPQKGIRPDEFVNENYEHFYLQPMDNVAQEENILACIKYCKANPKWKLSVQIHKIIGLP